VIDAVSVYNRYRLFKGACCLHPQGLRSPKRGDVFEKMGFEDVVSFQLFQYLVVRWAVVNTALNIRVPYRLGISKSATAD
jgi:hypothetical protein